MRVALFPADTTGCGRYRLIDPAKAAGVEAIFPKHLDDSTARREALAQADVVVFQRPAHPLVAQKIPLLQSWGKAVVVDMDDDLAALPPEHPAVSIFDRAALRNMATACQLADLVTVTTPALARRWGFGKARVIPNYVPERLLEISAERDGRTVGWAGVTTTHVYDLTATGGGVAQAINETGARFLLIGKRRADAQKQLQLTRPPNVISYVPFDRYPEYVARFDVGIAPLVHSQFNAAKSGLKLLEMGALGVPVVASPSPDYIRLHSDGIGILADHPRDWRREVRQLLQDPVWAEEVAARAEDAVAEHHLLERNAWRWAECWAEAAERRTGKSTRNERKRLCV